MFYILHGEEEFTRSEQVAKLKERVMVDGLGDLNVTELDGRRLTLRELQDVCNTLPFLSERRLVVVEGMLQRLGPRSRKGKEAQQTSESDKALAEELMAYLPQLPPTTRLVFVEPKTLPRNHPALKQAGKIKDAYVHQFDVPDAGKLSRWIQRRAQKQGSRDRARGCLPTGGVCGRQSATVGQRAGETRRLCGLAAAHR